ncbi:MAG: hypothetical protein SO181_02100 [Frisingicoccus sp.]|uniref:hypothetical protein n=1 Tax=Frisingicoccus sp. TaxID=1918627 RepID=UPI002A818ED9|nr:hypothetical protein [Frisingicoccus sp.]MDY4833930.1 hypothetical protein [Frisingicoccus sp.]
MSIQTQIDRISESVSAALTALTEKGVTVPGGTKVDDLATLIAAIESGGGGSSTLWGRPYETGSFTLAEDVSSTYTIGDFSDWLKYTTSDGNQIKLNYNIVAFLWMDASSRTTDIKTLYCGAYQAIFCGNTVGAGSCGYGRGSSNWTAIKNGGIGEWGGVLQVYFTTTYIGHAGDTYHWLLTKVKL